MFQGFAHVWTPAIVAKRLGRRPLRVVIAGEPVVVFRGQDGAFGALIDRCPHRGVALSLGRVAEDGCLECRFHGWRFATDGEARFIPFNPDAKRGALAAAALPVRQVGDMIWVYTAPRARPDAEPAAPDGLTAPNLFRTYVTRDWACHWTRAMENMLDSPHLPYVHRRTIGRTLRRKMTTQSRMDIVWEDTPWGGRARANLDGQHNPVFLDYFRPNIMALNIPIPGRHLRVHAIVVPAEEGRTRLTVVGSRDFARTPLMNPWFAWLNGLIADEDRAVVESSGPEETPPIGAEPSLPTDRATLRFRKYYHDTLRGASAAAPEPQG